MSETTGDLPTDLKYTKSHEWVRTLPDSSLEIGITDHAQSALGDLVFVEVPEAGRHLRAGAACAVVESVKAASDIYSPVDGHVVASNAALAANPELVNQAPYTEGWLIRIVPDASAAQPASPASPASPAAPALLDAAEYARYLAAETT